MTRSKKLTHLDFKKKEAFKIYKSWKKAYCPAIDAYIHFTLHGWKHLLNKKYRSGAEKIKRLDILPFAKQAIQQATTVKSIRQKEEFIIYELIEEVDGVKMSILIIKMRNTYVFLSNFRA